MARKELPSRALVALAGACTPRKYLGDFVIDDEKVPYGIPWVPVHVFALEWLHEHQFWTTVETLAVAQQVSTWSPSYGGEPVPSP